MQGARSATKGILSPGSDGPTNGEATPDSWVAAGPACVHGAAVDTSEGGGPVDKTAGAWRPGVMGSSSTEPGGHERGGANGAAPAVREVASRSDTVRTVGGGVPCGESRPSWPQRARLGPGAAERSGELAGPWRQSFPHLLAPCAGEPHLLHTCL